MKELRCGQCSKLLGRYQGHPQLEIKCPRCRYINILVSPSVVDRSPPIIEKTKK